MQTKSELELYIHIPFCVRKCNYCDFLSAPADEKTIDKYVDKLINEVADRSLKGDHVVTSIFVGGGTPTVLSGDRLAEILAAVKIAYDVDENAEITLECNPGTADLEKLKKCREAGFNRISIGLQSARDEELLRIGRIHDYSQFLKTYQNATIAGFENINVDLITALPEQKMEDVEESLDKILALNPRPQHISAYSLIVEEGTYFGKLYEEGKLDVPDEDLERQMHWEVVDRLEKEGYRQYELSNLAMPGYECRHNVGYWIRKEYLGLGIGAASLIGNRRCANTKDINAYILGDNTFSEDYELESADEMGEFMFLGLRMTDGINIDKFRELFGCEIDDIYHDGIEKSIGEGLLEKYNSGKNLRLTRRGQDLANYVFQRFV